MLTWASSSSSHTEAIKDVKPEQEQELWANKRRETSVRKRETKNICSHLFSPCPSELSERGLHPAQEDVMGRAITQQPSPLTQNLLEGCGVGGGGGGQEESLKTRKLFLS